MVLERKGEKKKERKKVFSSEFVGDGAIRLMLNASGTDLRKNKAHILVPAGLGVNVRKDRALAFARNSLPFGSSPAPAMHTVQNSVSAKLHSCLSGACVWKIVSPNPSVLTLKTGNRSEDGRR